MNKNARVVWIESDQAGYIPHVHVRHQLGKCDLQVVPHITTCINSVVRCNTDLVCIDLHWWCKNTQIDLQNWVSTLHTLCSLHGFKTPAVLVYSNDSVDLNLLTNAMQSGARGIFVWSNTTSVQEFLMALNMVVNGTTFVSKIAMQMVRGQYNCRKTQVLYLNPHVSKAVQVSFGVMLEQESNTEIAWVQTFDQLYNHLADPKYCSANSAVIISSDLLLSHKHLSAWDIAHSINTRRQLNNTGMHDLKLYADVAIDTNIKLVRLLLQTDNINGLCGMPGNDFSYAETRVAFEKITSGEYHIPWRIQQMLDQNKVSSKRQNTKSVLTKRQQQIANLICERGFSNKAIANNLNISESTVKLHLGHILKKFKIRNRTQLAVALQAHTTPV